MDPFILAYKTISVVIYLYNTKNIYFFTVLQLFPLWELTVKKKKNCYMGSSVGGFVSDN